MFVLRSGSEKAGALGDPFPRLQETAEGIHQKVKYKSPFLYDFRQNLAIINIIVNN